jgi:hypothetical protein
MAELTETQHAVLLAELNKAISRAEKEVAVFSEKLQTEPLTAFESYGSRAITAAAVMAVYNGARSTIEDKGFDFDAPKAIETLTRQLMGKTAAPSYYSGMLSLPLDIEERAAKARLAELLRDVLTQ